MRDLYAHLLRPLLFALDPEAAHHAAALGLRALHRSRTLRSRVRPAPPDPALAVEVFGLRFPTPVGVAAGFDKGAAFYNGLGALGFGFVEVGTVTARAQPGNPSPRLFRLPRDRALVNRMGFNNPGAEAAARAIEAHPPDGIVLGINLGKSKVTPLDQAADDYAASARRLAPLADYLVLNVSSPNTPGLRALQAIDALRGIVRAVRAVPTAAAVPLLVKIAPDLADEDIDAVVDMALEERLAGLVATNTTVAREGLASAPAAVAAAGDGGLSGAPVRRRSTAVIARIRRRAGAALPVVGAGGVFTADDAWEKVRAGASLVQVYTGFVYEGPTQAVDLARGLSRRLRDAGFASLEAAVGTGAAEM